MNVNADKVNIHQSWKKKLRQEFESEYFAQLKSFLIDEKSKYIIYPPSSMIFSAFDICHFDDVRVVILGQDPYHGRGQAHGLCFSVPENVPVPPSLKNIYKEINIDLHLSIPKSGNLSSWAMQGVLLLNATLTVRADMAGSHQNKGWERFTDRVISVLSDEREKLVFLLWGNYARAKKSLIDEAKHLVLEAAHPSPLSAHKGFFGCKHFSQSNQWLLKHNIEPVNWGI
jgi:uracil-DNA glycosylase